MVRAISWTIDGWMPSDGSSSRISEEVTDHDAPDRQLLLLAAGQRSGLLGAPLGENRNVP